MNPATLERLLNDCVSKVRESESALKRLDVFCEKNWNITFSDIQSDMDVEGDHIVEWLMYGTGNADVKAFIKFMNEHTDKGEKRLDEN